MICKLCLQERQLRMSHVIPEMLYRPLYGLTHQIRSVHQNLPYIRFLRKGLRQMLLCNDCEIIIGRYESYFSKVWYGVQGLPSKIPPGIGKVKKSGLDYRSFMLFHFSILWRASVSSLPEFRDVILGDDQEKLRVALLSGDSVDPVDYQLGASILLRPNSRKVHGGVVSVPTSNSQKGVRMFSAIYSGCIWHYVIGSDASRDVDVLQEDGTIYMAVFDISNIPVISQGLVRATAARRKK